MFYKSRAANDPKHWRTLAVGARHVADILTDATTRGHMLACAEAYERLALLAERERPSIRHHANDA